MRTKLVRFKTFPTLRVTFSFISPSTKKRECFTWKYSDCKEARALGRSFGSKLVQNSTGKIVTIYINLRCATTKEKMGDNTKKGSMQFLVPEDTGCGDGLGRDFEVMAVLTMVDYLGLFSDLVCELNT